VTIITELLDVRNRSLVARFQKDEFIVSEDITTAIMAQVSENPELIGITQELLSPTDGAIALIPASALVAVEQPMDFYAVTHAGLEQGCIPLGIVKSEAHGATSILLNPLKSQHFRFGREDSIVVVR